MRRVLIKYAKRGDAAFLSHRETIRILDRALRRSDLPLTFTAGYNPRPRMSFSPALPLGIAAEAEYMEVAVEAEVNVAEAEQRLNEALPIGLSVREVQVLASNMPRLSRWARYGLYRISGGEKEDYLLLSLSGEKQGRLKEALEKMAERSGRPVQGEEVTRMGLYASRYEVFEDVRETVCYYDGANGELEEMAGERI